MTDLQAQLEARKNLLRRRNDNNQPLETAETEQKVTESIEAILRNIEQRKSHLRDLQLKITQLQNEYEREAIELAKDEEVLRRFQEVKIRKEKEKENKNKNVVVNNNSNNTADKPQTQITNNKIESTNNKQQQQSQEKQLSKEEKEKEEEEKRKKQEQNDAEIALQLQRQFDIEENDNDNNDNNGNSNNNNENINQHSQNISSSGNEGRTIYSYSFGTNPSNMVTITNTTTNENDTQNRGVDPYSLLSQFHNNNIDTDDNDENNSFFSPFNSSFFNSSFGSFNNQNNNRDPLEQLFGMPLLRMRGMGGMRMPFVDVDNLDHDQLLTLFPNVPRGASEENIQALPENVYVPLSKENKNNNSNNSNNNNNNVNNDNTNEKKEKNNDEVCCICLEEFKNGDPIRRLPCLHIFHKNEIDTWLRRNHVCPICRIPIEQQQPQQQQ